MSDFLPYFRVFPAETISDERYAGWTAEERGVWFHLLLHAWKNGSIPAAEADLARLNGMKPAAFRRVWAAIGDRFIPHPDEPGRLTSRRLEVEREEAHTKSQAGRKGAASRWAKRKQSDRDAVASPPQSDHNAEAMPASQRSATHLIAAQRSDEPQKPRSLDICREAWRDQHPAAARLMDDLSAKGVHLDPPRKPTVSDAVERAAATLGPAGALQVVLDAHSTDPHTSLGWFSNALYRAANGRPAAQATRGVQALPQNYAAEF